MALRPQGTRYSIHNRSGMKGAPPPSTRLDGPDSVCFSSLTRPPALGSAHVDTAVGMDGLAGDVAGLLGGEKGHDGGDFLRLAEAAQGYVGL